MSDITLSQVKSIIEYVGHPCEDPENLAAALNIFVQQYETIKDKPQPDKRTKKKELNQNKKSFTEWHDVFEESLLSSYSLIGNGKESLLSRGLSEEQIDTALTVLLFALDNNQKERGKADGFIESAINSIPDKPQAKFKNVFLCGLLPSIYEEYFGMEFGISQSSLTNKVGGPGVRFVKAVSEYMNIPMKEANIAQSYKRFKA